MSLAISFHFLRAQHVSDISDKCASMVPVLVKGSGL